MEITNKIMQFYRQQTNNLKSIPHNRLMWDSEMFNEKYGPVPDLSLGWLGTKADWKQFLTNKKEQFEDKQINLTALLNKNSLFFSHHYNDDKVSEIISETLEKDKNFYLKNAELIDAINCGFDFTAIIPQKACKIINFEGNRINFDRSGIYNRLKSELEGAEIKPVSTYLLNDKFIGYHLKS